VTREREREEREIKEEEKEQVGRRSFREVHELNTDVIDLVVTIAPLNREIC